MTSELALKVVKECTDEEIAELLLENYNTIKMLEDSLFNSSIVERRGDKKNADV